MDEKKKMPLQVTKAELRELLGMSGQELRNEIFTDNWLEVMNWTYQKDYRNVKKFNRLATKQIYALLKGLKLADI